MRAVLAVVISQLIFVACNAQVGRNNYVLAERLFSDRKYAAAVDEFKKAIEGDPKSALAQQALFRIAVIQYLYLDNYFESVKHFRQFVSISQNKELVYQAEKSIGEIYFGKTEDYRLAIEQYKRLLEKYPESNERDYFMLRMAKAYYGALSFDQAIQVYRDLIKSFPNSPNAAEAYYQIGNTYYTRGDPDQAIKIFEEVLSKYPTSPQAIFAQFGIGSCYEEKDRYDQALEWFAKVLDKHPARNVVEAKIKRLKERLAK